MLLCGFLLGFGLKAYVCLGASSDGSHAWVLTCEEAQSEDSPANQQRKINNWKFWESLTGRVYNRDDPRVNYLYRTVGCVFNDKEFYANIQLSDQVTKTDFDLYNPSLWKGMGDIKIFTPDKVQEYTRLELTGPISADQANLQEEEIELKVLAALGSQEVLPSLKVDESLSFFLAEILQTEELNTRLNGAINNTKPKFMLSDSLKSWLPKNYIFKGLPIEFRSSDCYKIVDTVLKYGGVGELLERGKHPSTRYGIRCKIFPYPEDRLAVWLMIACIYSEEEG